MADTFPPNVIYDQGIYVPQLPEEFKISKSALYDYYSTNSGMFPKNPGGGGGGGGSEAEIQALKREVRAISSDLGDVHDEQGQQNTAIQSLNNTREAMTSAANSGEIELSSIKTSADIYEIDDIINNQAILSAAQYTLLNAINRS